MRLTVIPMTIDEETPSITLRFVEGDREDFNLVAFLDDEFSQMREKYALMRGVPSSAVVLFYNGNQICDKETPSALKMEDDDVIVVKKIKKTLNKKDNLIKPEEIKGKVKI